MSKTRTIVVDEERTISFMGDDCRVYATPSFVRDLEHLSRDLIIEHIDAGEDSVGTGNPVALARIDEKDRPALFAWLEVLKEELGVEAPPTIYVPLCI